MSKVKVELNIESVRSLLKEVGSTTCMQMANEALNRCREGYVVEERKYPRRNAAIIKTDTYDAYKDNMENNTIIKAVWGG